MPHAAMFWVWEAVGLSRPWNESEFFRFSAAAMLLGEIFGQVRGSYPSSMTPLSLSPTAPIQRGGSFRGLGEF